jgi:hypothetical protein
MFCLSGNVIHSIDTLIIILCTIAEAFSYLIDFLEMVRIFVAIHLTFIHFIQSILLLPS